MCPSNNYILYPTTGFLFLTIFSHQERASLPSKFLWLFISILVLCVKLCFCAWGGFFTFFYIRPRWHKMHLTHVEQLQQSLSEISQECYCGGGWRYICKSTLYFAWKSQTCKSNTKQLLLRARWISMQILYNGVFL